MMVYLDNCVFNRPFDDQSQIRVRLETEAKLYVQDLIKQKGIALIWSYILNLENAHNPHDERRDAIQRWRDLSSINIVETIEILAIANQLLNFGIKPKDTLHVASAIVGKADYLLTTDDKLLSCTNKHGIMKAINPVNFIRILE